MTNDKGTELPNQNARRKGNLQVLGNIEAGTIKKLEMKEKIKKEYFRRTRKLPEAKLADITSK